MAPRGHFDGPELDLDAALSEQRDERVSPIVAIVGVIGVIVGLVFWGSLAMSVLSSGESSANDNGSTDRPAIANEDENDAAINCDNIQDASALSPARAAAYEAECATPEPEATPEPPPDTRTNRENCDEIRGTDYRSPEERTWFLANCVSR